jgi:hypothetical protein
MTALNITTLHSKICKILYQTGTWVKRYRAQHDDAPDRLCIVYDSQNAFEAVSRDIEPAKNAAAAQVAQGVQRYLEADGVQVSFLWTKGHLDKFESTKDMMCAKLNGRADDWATKGQNLKQGYVQLGLAKRHRCG